MSHTHIQCGFQSIDLKFFRGKSVSKGKKLFESRHVLGVEEIINPEEGRSVVGKVIPQTRVNNAPYEVKIELRVDRTILKSQCGCKAGLSRRGCKHVAAVCIFINDECTQSKTDQPQLWNQPSTSQIDKYKKGCRIEDLFPCRDQSIDCNSTYIFDDLQNVPDAMLDIGCLFSNYLKAERDVEPERKVAAEEGEKRKKEIYNVVEEMYLIQEKRCNQGTYEVYSIDHLKMRLKKSKCPDELEDKYKKKVVLTKSECIDVAVRSLSQSDCFEWFEQRALRITCSSKAHRIKTRTHDFERLAYQFKKEKFDGRMIPAMKYGIEMESCARECFTAATGLEVKSVGLIINHQQPFLATSPDGIILSEETLLEIKCPFSCKDKNIVNCEERTSNVSYLDFDYNGNIFLKKSDKYYTQIQVSMYILNMKKCRFFVYSPVNYVHIIVQRDDNFLGELIPKIEWFYFKYYLPLVA